MVQVPSDASDSGNSRSAASAAACASRERDARFADHHVGVEVDLADRAQALGRDDDLLAAHVRRLPADEPGVAALRNHGRSRLVAEGRDALRLPWSSPAAPARAPSHDRARAARRARRRTAPGRSARGARPRYFAGRREWFLVSSRPPRGASARALSVSAGERRRRFRHGRKSGTGQAGSRTQAESRRR